MANDVQDAALRLSDLRRAHPADASLENLLTTLTGKIQACARLAVFEYEAGSEGHEALAAMFRDLAEIERQSFDSLLGCLRGHLNDLTAETPRSAPLRRSTTAAGR